MPNQTVLLSTIGLSNKTNRWLEIILVLCENHSVSCLPSGKYAYLTTCTFLRNVMRSNVNSQLRDLSKHVQSKCDKVYVTKPMRSKKGCEFSLKSLNLGGHILLGLISLKFQILSSGYFA